MIVLSEMAVLFFISQFGFIYEISSTDRNSRRSNKILDTLYRGFCSKQMRLSLILRLTVRLSL